MMGMTSMHFAGIAKQNYNMIDGAMNNHAPKHSVIERLQEKQSELSAGPNKGSFRFTEVVTERNIN